MMSAKKRIFLVIFIIYLAVLLRITVFRSGFDLSNSFSVGEINLVPLADLSRIFAADKLMFIYLFFGNIIWFIPFGFLLRRLTRLRFAKTVLLGFCLSAFIEIMQFVFNTGVLETDDLLLNTLGTAIGAIILTRRCR